MHTAHSLISAHVPKFEPGSWTSNLKTSVSCPEHEGSYSYKDRYVLTEITKSYCDQNDHRKISSERMRSYLIAGRSY